MGGRHNLAERAPEALDLGDLITRTACGEESALRDLYDRTAGLVHGLALRIIGDPAAAEEVTEDVYLQVWRQAERYDPSRGAPLSWLLTVTRSRAIDRRRAGAGDASRRAPLAEAVDLPSPGPGPEVEVAVVERQHLVRRALAALVPEQRRVIELAYFGGLSHSEIAQAFRQPLGTVKTRVRLGMERLREALALAIEEPL